MPDKKTEFKQTVATGGKGRDDGDRYREDVTGGTEKGDDRTQSIKPAPEVK
jgi:hypothetical protein